MTVITSPEIIRSAREAPIPIPIFASLLKPSETEMGLRGGEFVAVATVFDGKIDPEVGVFLLADVIANVEAGSETAASLKINPLTCTPTTLTPVEITTAVVSIQVNFEEVVDLPAIV